MKTDRQVNWLIAGIVLYAIATFAATVYLDSQY